MLDRGKEIMGIFLPFLSLLPSYYKTSDKYYDITLCT